MRVYRGDAINCQGTSREQGPCARIGVSLPAESQVPSAFFVAVSSRPASRRSARRSRAGTDRTCTYNHCVSLLFVRPGRKRRFQFVCRPFIAESPCRRESEQLNLHPVVPSRPTAARKFPTETLEFDLNLFRASGTRGNP